MATLSTTNPTLMDLAKRQDPDGKIARIVGILEQTNPILDHMTFQEGNLETGHRFTYQTKIPQPTWRMINQGVLPTKGGTAQSTSTCGNLEAYAQVDKDLADLNGNTNAFRLSEDRMHIEGMNQEMASTLFFGNEAINPERYTGLSPLYNNLSDANAENIIDGGGTGADNASIWLVVWGPNTVFGIVPKGSTAGLTMKNMGQTTAENVDGNGGMMEVYRTHYQWKSGLVVRDWRYVVRIANIDRSLITNDAATGPVLNDLITDAIERVPNLDMGRAGLYMDRSLRTALRHQSKNAVKNSTLTHDMVAGKRITAVDGIPVYRTDALANNEAQVV